MEESVLVVHDLVKCYDTFCAVDHLSFDVCAGEIFGLLGPNGAGKTTTIRTIMDIFKPDGGYVKVLGHDPALVRGRVGYLPEERGLYREQKVLDVLVYLAQLKGVERSIARTRAMTWLERLELAQWASHKVLDLSRGMQQKIQLVASLVHDPDLIILDEPFQGLDPVNVELIKRLIRELQAEGKAIALSAHEMSLVEALCDRIVLINHGKAVLYGRLDDIKRQYSPHTVRLRTDAQLGPLSGVVRIERTDHAYTLTLQNRSPQDVLRELVERNVPIESFEVASVPLEDIFIDVVREQQHE